MPFLALGAIKGLVMWTAIGAVAVFGFKVVYKIDLQQSAALKVKSHVQQQVLENNAKIADARERDAKRTGKLYADLQTKFNAVISRPKTTPVEGLQICPANCKLL